MKTLTHKDASSCAQARAGIAATLGGLRLAVFWIAMIPVSYELGWLKSVVYVSALSLWALLSGHWSAWQAVRVEVQQAQQAAEAAAHPLEEKVVEAMVKETEVEKSPPTS